jgi:hypothetical protein
MTHDPINKTTDKHCTVVAAGLYPVEGRGFIYLLDGRLVYVPTRSIEKYIGDKILELIKSDLESYNPSSEYVLLAITGESFEWVGTRDFAKLEIDDRDNHHLFFNLYP